MEKKAHSSLSLWIAVLFAAIAALLFVNMAHAVAPTPTPEPAPILSFSKTAAVDGNYITYTIIVTNSGNLASGSQTVLDTLPAGIDWFIASDTMGCEISQSSASNKPLLRCGPFSIRERALNEARDAFVNGTATVTIGGLASLCGDYPNTALLMPGAMFRSATANILCPATPTPATPTQTPQPTATAQPTQTAAPTVAALSPTVRAPLPPRTGDTAPMDVEQGMRMATLVSILIGMIGLLATSVIIWKRARRIE